ncbi:TIGR03767 family metallophosphoesterase [Streptomyces sp. SUK 48]|uniref:TIGR03767 family metallophosphoesterase n=1 Tax=Streptomyces sp. SUK 48 TaxID=2582831 RepID=UPI00129BA7A5|nr:TIGR03767 family metallophosphoesterase [Streptomyces sp. SUK 48]
MSRLRSAATSAAGVDRRTVLTAVGAASLAAGVGFALRPTDSEAATATAAPGQAPVAQSRPAAAAPLAPYRTGTTLASVSTARGSGYRRLADGPGWQRVVRTELARPKVGRDKRRHALAAFVQFTDLHLQDVQHPLRLEYLRAAHQDVWRPHEALTVPGAVSLVERVNALRGAPVTGAPLQFVMTTGDNTDNNARSELEWFMKVMSGGRITPNSGDPRHYEGVQNSGLSLYWQPESTAGDSDKALGFPHLDGFLAAAIREVRSPGLNLPWYSTVGNHDALPLGIYGARGDQYLAEAAIGGKKLFSVSAADAKKLQDSIWSGKDPKGAAYRDFLKSQASGMRSVTADESRALYTPAEYLKAHLDPAHQGHGPAGHGYSSANLDAGTQYYAFRIAEDVIGVSLDTTDAGGHYQGSVGSAQLKWLEKTLQDNKGSHVVVFSHHTSDSMTNTRPDPARSELRHTGAEVVSLLARHAHVLAWVNGHKHENEITPHRNSAGGAFWEISTASHIDHPHLARIIELVDNKDGTISLFTTLIESAAPARTDFTDLSQTGLASLYRELAFNAPGAKTNLAGTSVDRNTELVLKKR